MKCIKGLILILMMDCEQSARLTSESFDRKLTKFEVLALKIHQFCCRSSYRVARQMEMVYRQLQQSNSLEMKGDNLSNAARSRIRSQLRGLMDQGTE